MAAVAANAKALLDITAAIARADSEKQVFAALVDGVAQALGASSAALWLLDEDGRNARLVRSFGHGPEAQAQLALLPLQAAVAPAVDSLRSGAPIWISSREELVARYPQLAAQTTALRSYRVACLPLGDARSSLGTLGLTIEQARELTAEERDFLELVARYAVLAIQRQRALEAERRSVAAAQSAAQRQQQQAQPPRSSAEHLFRFAQAVVGAQRVEEVFDAALTAIERSLTAERSAILTYDEQGVMRFRASHQLSELYRSAVEGHSPWPRDAAAPEPLLVADAQHDPAWADYHALFRAEGIGALAFIPLVSGGRLLGKFMVYYDQRHEFTEQEIDTALEIAYHLASVISRFAVLAELEETIRYNELFAGVLGHDLRNPLAAMVTAAQLLSLRCNDEKTNAPLQRILSSGARMARMIEQLLDFTRARLGGGIQLDRRPGDLWQIAKQTLEEVELANSGWRFRVDAVGDLDGDWDADRLARVFSNLSANAVQHGAPNAPVLVRMDGSDPERVEISFENGGVVRPDLLSTLFEPFRNTRHKRDGSQGLGLGLFITREIVRAHGGEISVSSSAAEGTTFRIRLPRRGPATVDRVRSAAPRSASSTWPASEQRPVFIVDDDVDVREALAELLEGRGFPVTMAANGKEALDRLRGMQVPPAVILLDLVMPVMDGYDFLIEHQLDSRLSDIPVVVITADQGAGGGQLGPHVPVLTKPVQIPQLLSTLERLQAAAVQLA